MNILPLKSPSARTWFASLPTISLALAVCLLLSACAEQTSPPREVASQTPRVTYKYKGDRELMAANDKAVTYCSQYHAVPHTADIEDSPNGSKEVTFDCIASAPAMAATVPPTTVGSNLAYPYRSDQELLDAARNADAYCLDNGSQRAVATFVTNLDGTRTVTFQCVP
jgi:hypothetical protein